MRILERNSAGMIIGKYPVDGLEICQYRMGKNPVVGKWLVGDWLTDEWLISDCAHLWQVHNDREEGD